MEEDSNRHYYAHPKDVLTGKIMLIVISLSFSAIFIILFYHIYARWLHLRSRRTQILRHTHLVFSGPPRGLDLPVLNSLPVFFFSSKTHVDLLECAVCLCEFEENEKGRLLPKCNHSFHIDCIDMWFHSHSTCPLCRAPVVKEECQTHVSVTVDDGVAPDGGGGGGSEDTVSSGGFSSCGNGENVRSCSSSSSQMNPLGFVELAIDVENSSDGVMVMEDEHGSRSPGNPVQSLKKDLSRDRQVGVGGVSYCSFAKEVDVERGPEEEEDKR